MPSPPNADSGDESDDEPGDKPEIRPDDGSDDEPNTTTAPESGGESGDEPNNESGDESRETEADNGSDDDSGDEPEARSDNESGDEYGDESETGSGHESGDDTAGPSSAPTSPKRPTRTPLPSGRPTKITIKFKTTRTQTAPSAESQDGTDLDSPAGPSAGESVSDSPGDGSDEDSPKKRKNKGKQNATHNEADTDSDPEVPEESSEPAEPEDDASRDDSEEHTNNSHSGEGSDPEGSQDSDQGTPDEATPSRRSTPGSVGGNSEHTSTPSKTPQERKVSKNEDPIQIGSDESEQENEPHQRTIVHYGSDDETEMLVHERPDPDQTFDNGENTLNLEDYPSSVAEGPDWREEYDGSENDGDNQHDDPSGNAGGDYEDKDNDDDDSEVHLPDYTMFEPDETEGQPEMGRVQGSESDLSRQSSPSGVSPGFPRNNRSPSHSPDPSAGGQQHPSGSSGRQGSTAQGSKNGQSSGSNKSSATGGGNGSAATKTKNATGKRGRLEDFATDDEARPQKRQREDKTAVPKPRKRFPRTQYRKICPYPSPRESQPQTSEKRETTKRPSSSLEEAVEKYAKRTRLLEGKREGDLEK